MSYPGDPSLSPDVQHRILATFEQTLALAEQGNRQEALLGCDFVLRMDPHFAPARQLVERLNNGNGSLDVRDLRAAAPAAAATAQPAEDLFDLSGLGDELPDLPDEPLAAGGDLNARLQGLYASRSFEELLAAAEREVSAVIADPRLGALAEAARERLEAGPYVAKFLGKAQQVLAGGDIAEAGRLLAKARSLDATHPGIAALELEVAARAPAAPALAATPPPAMPGLAAELPSPLRSGMTEDLLGGGSGDAESERRIAQLLAEGQAALDGGDPQAAIDSWSRIFLIDIDHQEAARRIERARKVKAENERQVEEIFHDGIGSLEAGDAAAARRSFERVLELQPGYLAAREYLDQIEAGAVSVPRPRPAGVPPAAPGPAVGGGEAAAAPGHELPDLTDLELKEEILVPPEPGEAPARSAERRPAAAAAVREGLFDRKFLYIGGAVLALVLAAAAYVFLNRDSFWPNSDSDELAAPAPAPDPVERALALHRAGKAPLAIAQLRRLPLGSPHHQRAQALIAEWESPAAPAAPAGPPALAPAVEARRQAVLSAARQAFSGGSFLLAIERFEEAATIAELDAADADQLSKAKVRLEPLSQQIALVRDREWEYAIPALWRLREADPGNRDIDRLLVDSYYNMGVRDLQRFDPESAAKQFEEALKLDPDDEGARRQSLFAQTYRERQQDLLFRIYVKYLTFR